MLFVAGIESQTLIITDSSFQIVRCDGEAQGDVCEIEAAKE